MSITKPKISVVIPVYNTAQYLRRCLDSVANQTYDNLEILCVNDGSVDESGAILDEYAAKDKRFRVFHKENGGQASARNLAMNHATGDLMASVDSDDYLELYAYEHAISHLDDDVDMVWFGNHVVGDLDETHMAEQREFYRMKETGKMKLSEVPVVSRSGAMWNKLVRRSIIEKYHLRYPEGVIFEDLCLVANLVPTIGNVYMLDEQLYFYWQRTDSTMGLARSKSSQKSKDVLKIIPSMYAFYKENNLFENYRDLYDSFFAKFFNLANHYLPEDLKSQLMADAVSMVADYSGGDEQTQKQLLRKINESIYGYSHKRKIRFLGIPIYYKKSSRKHKICRILGIKTYEKKMQKGKQYKKTLFYRETPSRKSYCFFGIPIYTRKKDATQAKQLFGITYSKKKVQQPKNVTHITAQITYLNPNERLAGKKIVITGGGRGLGYAMAKKFIAEGAQVLIAGRNEETLKEKAAELNCHYLTLDVQDHTSFEGFIKKADELLGGMDSLVNNAGISLHEGNIRKVSPEQFDMQLSTNLKGAYFLAQEFIKLFEQKKRRDGSILFISSERGLFVDDIPYGLTKAAINSLVQGLAVRMLPSGIRVNAIAPGITISDMTGYSAEGNLYCAYNASKRVFLPEEVSETACFILSDCSRCITGQIIACDEGRAINPHWRRS